jgi:hypothetical protein
VNAEVRKGVNLRERVKALQEQNIEDRVRIQRLAVLSQPVTHDVTFTAERKDEPWSEG